MCQGGETALQADCGRFDSDRFHQITYSFNQSRFIMKPDSYYFKVATSIVFGIIAFFAICSVLPPTVAGIINGIVIGGSVIIMAICFIAWAIKEDDRIRHMK